MGGNDKWDFTGEFLCLICTLTFFKSCMLTWDKVLSLLYALQSKKKKKKRLQLSCYSIMYYLHLPFLFERANYNYYSPICVVSVFILVYSLNVYRFIDGSFINCPGLGSARTIVKVFPLCKWKKRLSQSSLRTFLWHLVN